MLNRRCAKLAFFEVPSKLLSVLGENDGVILGMEVFQEVRRGVVLNAEQTPEYSEIRFTGYDGGGDFVFVRKY